MNTSWINKDTEIYCSFAKNAGNTGCQLMNTMFYYYGMNKIYKSFSIDNIEKAVDAVRVLDIKGFAITMPYKMEVLKYVDEVPIDVETIGAANTVLNNNGKLKAYNTDYLAAFDILGKKDFEQPLYILGNGGYARAVQFAADILNFSYVVIIRESWHIIPTIRDSIIYNCTPVENISIHESNDFIDCIVTTYTGKQLATIQASYQFELYTGRKFPL